MSKCIDKGGTIMLRDKRNRVFFWAIIGSFNLAIIAFLAFYINENYFVRIYSKHKIPEFTKVMQEMKIVPLYDDKNLPPLTGWVDLRRPHPYCGFKALPTSLCISEEAKLEALHNSLGFRSHELGPKRPGVIRIAMLGSSAVWTGRKNEDTIIARLADLIGKRGFEVQYINAGISSANSNQALSVLVQDVLDLQPDIVISFDGYNDISNILEYNGRIGWPAFRWDPVSDRGVLKQLVPQYYLLRLSLVESVSLGLSDKAKRCQGVGVPLAA